MYAITSAMYVCSYTKKYNTIQYNTIPGPLLVAASDPATRSLLAERSEDRQARDERVRIQYNTRQYNTIQYFTQFVNGRTQTQDTGVGARSNLFSEHAERW